MTRIAHTGPVAALLLSIALAGGGCASPPPLPNPAEPTEPVILPVRPAQPPGPSAQDLAAAADRARRNRRIETHRQMLETSRVNSIGMPLALIAAPLCQDASFATLGTLPASLLEVPEGRRAAMQEAFGLEARPTFMFVILSLPAADAGLRAGDVLERIDGQPVGYGADARARLKDAVDLAGRRRAPLTLQVLRAEGSAQLRVHPVTACARAILVAEGASTPVRWQDGTLWISRRVLESLDDRQLAVMLAHAILTGPRPATGGRMDRAAAIDQRALAILRAAGYRLDGVATTWRKLSEMNLGWASPESYPLTVERIRSLESQAALARDSAPRPQTLRVSGQTVRLAGPAKKAPWLVVWRDDAFQGNVD